MARARKCVGVVGAAIGLVWAACASGAEKPTSTPATCVTAECHGQYGEQTYVHGPVSLGDCKSCHTEIDPNAHTYKLTREGKDLCEYCHLDQTSKEHVHEPLKTGDCMQCHDPHSGENRNLLLAPTIAALCRECHETGTDVKFPHGPVAVGECTICHDSHSADREDLLVDDATTLCFSCHVITKEQLGKFEFVHEPARNDCVGCHSPHGANNWKMIKADTPELCYACHEDIQRTAENSAHTHTAVTEKDGCLHCHTPHASTVQFSLKDAPMALCMTCHDEPVTTDTEEVIPSFTAQIQDKAFMHGPVAQKDCEGCHSTHGSDHFRLLDQDYPRLFYAPFAVENYALCFNCHPDSLVLTERTADLTDFRNGDYNLHYVHVNKEERGRTCRACHATHASDLPKHIRESVPYGAWNLPIQFTKTDTGGGCQPGCHLPLTYDREKPVTYDQETLVADETQ